MCTNFNRIIFRMDIEETHVYKRRWYILFVYCVISAMNNVVWNTWSPISQTCLLLFKWSVWEFSLLTNWGIICNLVFMPFSIWLLRSKGLRISFIYMSGGIALAVFVRVFTPYSPAITWTSQIGAFINGAVGPIASAATAMVSSVWFPASERGFATAIASNAMIVGSMVSALFGPMIVEYEAPMPESGNFSNASSIIYENDEKIETQRQEFMVYSYSQFAIACLAFICSIAYFPNHPPIPPTKSAAVERVDYFAGMKTILSSPKIWMITLAYCVPNGILYGWAGVLDVILREHGISEKEVGLMGFANGGLGIVIAVILGKLSYRFTKHVKKVIIASYSVSFVMYLWLAAMTQNMLPLNFPSAFIATTFGGAFLVGVSPLSFELASEKVYPVAECCIVGVQLGMTSIFGGTLLFLMMIPNENLTWMNWCMAASLIFGIFFMVIFKPEFKRQELDNNLRYLDETEGNCEKIPLSTSLVE